MRYNTCIASTQMSMIVTNLMLLFDQIKPIVIEICCPSINISLSRNFLNILLPAKFHENCQAGFGHREHQWVNPFVP